MGDEVSVEGMDEALLEAEIKLEETYKRAKQIFNLTPLEYVNLVKAVAAFLDGSQEGFVKNSSLVDPGLDISTGSWISLKTGNVIVLEWDKRINPGTQIPCSVKITGIWGQTSRMILTLSCDEETAARVRDIKNQWIHVNR